MGWRRVSRKNPCPICGKPDWCLMLEDGSAVICPRVAEGATKCLGDAGWYHRIHEDVGMYIPRARKPEGVQWPAHNVKLANMAKECQEDAGKSLSKRSLLGRLAERLGHGIKAEALRDLGVGWLKEKRAFVFPMGRSNNRIIGLRIRGGNQYWSFPTSRQGLFIPFGTFTKDKVIFIAEGPTDTAALLSLGLNAVGRPSCHGGAHYLDELCIGGHCVIVADKDKVGLVGAERAAMSMKRATRVSIIQPPDPYDDTRDWVNGGATVDDVRQLVDEVREYAKCPTA